MTHEKLFIDRARLVFPILFKDQGKDECWKWSGQITWSVKKDGKTLSTVLRRVAYAAFVGDIPMYHEIKMACKDRDRVNPKHMTTRVSVRQITKQREGIQVLAVTNEGSEVGNNIMPSTLVTEATND